MLDDRRQQTQDADDNEARPKDQGRVDGIVRRVHAGRIQVGGQPADAEPEGDQRQGRANPRQQGSFGGLPAAFLRQVVGRVGIEGLVGHRLSIAEQLRRPRWPPRWPALSSHSR